MKVCHLTSAHPWTDTRILEKQCKSLAAAGHEVTLVAPGSPPANLVGVQAIGVPALGSSRVGRMALLAPRVWLTALKQHADVYHFHDPELLPLGLIARGLGKRVIYDAHEEVHLDILTKFYLPRPARRGLAASYRWLEQLAAPIFSAVFAANESTHDRLTNYSDHVTLVPNYPARNEIQPVPRSRDERHGVAYIGAITKDRGISEMVLSASQAGIKLVLAGRFENPELESAIRGMPQWSNVDYRGPVNRQQVAQILGEVSAGLVLLHPDPNNMACLSTKLLEYMSAGIPVIASDFPSYRNIVDRFNCGICVPPLSIPAITQAMHALASNTTLSDEMGQRGRTAIVKSINWESEEPDFLAAYQRVLTDSTTRRR